MPFDIKSCDQAALAATLETMIAEADAENAADQYLVDELAERARVNDHPAFVMARAAFDIVSRLPMGMR